MLLLVDYLPIMLDAPLLYAFIEHWHNDTFSFHVPFSGVTITLDDISNIFYLPHVGNFFTHPLMNLEIIIMAPNIYMGVTRGMVLEEFKASGDAHFCPSWLRNTYQSMVEHSMYEATTRVYMFHLIGYTNLSNRSCVYIDDKNISVFSYFKYLNWAWGYAIVVIIYHVLGEAISFETRHTLFFIALWPKISRVLKHFFNFSHFFV